MPRIGVPKENLEGLPPLPVGKYQFRLDSFSPKLSKNANSPSINLNAKMVIINHPTLNDRIVYNNANVNFSPSLYDLAHAVGVKFEGEDNGNPNPEFPGEFICSVHGPACDSSDPENWHYQGPLLGQTGELQIMEGDNGKGKMIAKLGRYFCKVPGCQAKHKESLL